VRRREAGPGAPRGGRAGWLLVILGLAVGVAGCAAQRRPVLRHVTIQAFRYRPADLQAEVGDTVEWRNRDIVPHTATARNRRWDAGDIQPGAVGRVVLRERGAQPYGCLYHREMQARLEVH
jgi:plastocyanin